MTIKYLCIYTDDSYEIYIPDVLGSTRVVVADDREVENAIVYDSYGNIEIAYSQDTPNYAFAGGHHYYADNTGLTYLKHRYYDPEVGRFISRDPIGYLGGFNLYNYVNSNPIYRVDPSGLLPLPAIGAIGGGIVGGIGSLIDGGSPGEVLCNMAVGAALGAISGWLAQILPGKIPDVALNCFVPAALGVGGGAAGAKLCSWSRSGCSTTPETLKCKALSVLSGLVSGCIMGSLDLQIGDSFFGKRIGDAIKDTIVDVGIEVDSGLVGNAFNKACSAF